MYSAYKYTIVFLYMFNKLPLLLLTLFLFIDLFSHVINTVWVCRFI